MPERSKSHYFEKQHIDNRLPNMLENFALVTGAAGFVGSRLAQVLLDSGRNVIALDCFLPDLYSAEIKRHRWNQISSNNGATLKKFEFDLRTDDFNVLKDLPIDSIFNQAAMPGLISDWSKFSTYYDCNLSALNRLLEFARTLELKSFIQASTSSVYGASAVGNELQESRPISPYGVSKLAAEKLLLAYLDCNEVPVKILRYFSIYGPGQRPDMAYAKIIKSLKNDEIFLIHGDGEQKRSNTYIDDVVEATILADYRANPGEIMNICGDETVSLNLVISILEELTGNKLRVTYGNPRKGDQAVTSGDNSLAKKKLDWNCKTSIHLGLRNQLLSR